MCNCSGKNQKNQTSKEVLNFLANKDLNTKGLGFFLVPNPEVGIYEFKKVIVKDLTLTEAFKRGLNCEAYKFLPYGMELKHPEKGMKVINSLEDLSDFDCRSNPCAGGYGPACWDSHCYCTSW